MNVLFVLYHDFTANSAAHVHSLANALMESNAADCAVCVPEGVDTVTSIGGAPRYRPMLFAEVEAGKLEFADGRRHVDIIHAWTPREVNRKFIERLQAASVQKTDARLLIHLEDNEEHISARALGKKWSELSRMPVDVLDANVPLHLSHPIRYKHFMQSADAATVIVDKLRELVPANKKTAEVWCSADEVLFPACPVNYDLRERMAIPKRTTVIVYPGNVHPANAAEVRSLYTAIALLNREGVPAILVRAGRDFCEFLDLNGDWVRPSGVIELGLVPHKNMPAILAMADIFVQPGRPGEFNDYRFPSKLPEFLATGRPVILPASNVGLQMRHREEAYVVEDANAIAITEAVTEIVRDPQLRERLTIGSRRFFDERLSWKRGAEILAGLYRETLAQQSIANGAR